MPRAEVARRKAHEKDLRYIKHMYASNWVHILHQNVLQKAINDILADIHNDKGYHNINSHELHSLSLLIQCAPKSNEKINLVDSLLKTQPLCNRIYTLLETIIKTTHGQQSLEHVCILLNGLLLPENAGFKKDYKETYRLNKKLLCNGKKIYSNTQEARNILHTIAEQTDKRANILADILIRMWKIAPHTITRLQTLQEPHNKKTAEELAQNSTAADAFTQLRNRQPNNQQHR